MPTTRADGLPLKIEAAVAGSLEALATKRFSGDVGDVGDVRGGADS